MTPAQTLRSITIELLSLSSYQVRLFYLPRYLSRCAGDETRVGAAHIPPLRNKQGRPIPTKQRWGMPNKLCAAIRVCILAQLADTGVHASLTACAIFSPVASRHHRINTISTVQS